ncbi:MAG: hypothetical protein V3V42_02410 [Candidatus Omnitrophota bacterium]
MKRLVLVAVVFAAVTLAASGSAFSADKVLFSFERDSEGWEIPDWAYEQADSYVGEEIAVTKDVAKEGESSLKLATNFPGGRWNGAIVEVMEFFDWTEFSRISCDIYLPEDAPRGLKAKLVLTVGESWKWTEMSRSIKLEQGKWITISANLKPGSEDWKRTKPTDEFRADVRKIAIRVESNKAAYKGPVYIDNIVLSE